MIGNIIADDTTRIRKHGGIVYYVDAAMTDDSLSGTTPETAKKTIAAALAEMAAGDAVVIKTGAYDENGLDFALDGMEIWAERGAVLSDTTTSTQTLLISGNYCRIYGLIVSQAAQIGIKVTGTHCRLERLLVEASSIAFDIAGNSAIIGECNAQNYTTTGFDFSAAYCFIDKITAIGSGGATRGIYLSANTADYNTFTYAATAGNATRGLEVVTGCSGNTFTNCSSSNDDGKWLDTDETSVFINYGYDNLRKKELTLDGSASQNLFQITGSVTINFIYGIVKTALAADTTGAYLDLWDQTLAVNVTNSAGAPDISGFPTGSFMGKLNLSTAVMNTQTSATAGLEEVAGNVFAAFNVVQKTGGVATYIRLTRAGAGASGVIDWYADWSPLSEDGLLVAV